MQAAARVAVLDTDNYVKLSISLGLIDSGLPWEVEGQEPEPLGLCRGVILEGQADLMSRVGLGASLYI